MESTTRAVLLDLDGVLLEEHAYFSTIYSERFGVDLDVLKPFFTGVFRACQRGDADLKEELSRVLDDWKWPGTVEELMQLWFSEATIPNRKAIEQVQELRRQGILCYVASNNEKYRGEYIKEELGFKGFLDGFFYSYELRHQKSEQEYFRIALERLNVSPSEVLFLDNDEKNVQTAKSLGIDARVFQGLNDLAINA